MPNLSPWIEAQLKRGYSKEQIKKALIRKGYPPAAVAEVDEIGLSNLPSKKIPKKVSYKPIALIGVVIGIVFLVWLINVSPFFSRQQDLCDEFKEAEYLISCDDAVALALADKPGSIQDISIGTRRTPTESEGKILMKDTKLWLIDIRLDEPFYDEKLNKEIKLLKVGIGTDEHFGIYREIVK